MLPWQAEKHFYKWPFQHSLLITSKEVQTKRFLSESHLKFYVKQNSDKGKPDRVLKFDHLCNIQINYGFSLQGSSKQDV